MKRRFVLFLFLIPLVLFLQRAAPLSAADQVQITLTSNPPLSDIRPHGGPTGHIEPEHFMLEVRDANGALVPNVKIDYRMVAPQTNWFISTDVPRVEGVVMMDDHYVSATGQQPFNYIFPIRGPYQVTVQASPVTPGAFEPTTKTFDLNITEKESSAINLTILLIALVVFGALSGFLLMGSYLANRALGTATRTSSSDALIFVGALAVLAVAWVAFLVYAEVADANMSADDLAAAKLTDTVDASSSNAKLDFTVASPSPITPAQPATLTAHVTDNNGAPLTNVHYQISVVQIEDDKTVFAAETDAPDGTLNWTHDFWDGTEHSVKLVASPMAGTSANFEPVTLDYVVGVTPLAPPMRVKLLGTLYLLLPIILGLVIGIFLAQRAGRRRPTLVNNPALAG